MREPPRLDEAAIHAVLREGYGLDAVGLAFLPLGADAASAVFRVEAADGRAYLLKARTGGGFRPASLAVPRFLAARGVPHVLAPLPASDGRLWVDGDGFALSLYPFLDARPAVEVGLSAAQWRALGAALRQIHACRLPPALAETLPRERFTPSRRERLPALIAAVDGPAPGDPARRELAAFWRERRDEIHALIERADALGRRLRRRGLPPVLCHADLHTWNVLVDDGGRMWLVDWDEVVFAPKERDLMFVVGGIGRGLVGAEDTAAFLAGYGETAIDAPALAYYRVAWAVQDMMAYGETAFLDPDRGAVGRADAARGFMALFAPGNIVEIARAGDGV